MPFEKLHRDRKPVLMIVVGRQRVGKTTFLNALAQYLRGHGASFEIWDADKMNATNNMSLFHREALQPPSAEPEDVKAWLEERFTDLVDRRFDAMLDVGGGDTPLARLVAEVPIVPTLEDEGVRVVVVHVVGPDLADLDYLDRFEQDDLFAPEATLIVMNGGLVLSGRSLDFAFQQINDHDTITRSLTRGARIGRRRLNKRGIEDGERAQERGPDRASRSRTQGSYPRGREGGGGLGRSCRRARRPVHRRVVGRNPRERSDESCGSRRHRGASGARESDGGGRAPEDWPHD